MRRTPSRYFNFPVVDRGKRRRAGLSLGLALATGVLGLRTDPLPLAMHGALTGAGVGALQWVFLRQQVTMAGWWVLVVAACWALGWLVTRAVGVDLSKGWPVFGISGAAVFAALTGLGLLWLVRHPTP